MRAPRVSSRTRFITSVCAFLCFPVPQLAARQPWRHSKLVPAFPSSSHLGIPSARLAGDQVETSGFIEETARQPAEGLATACSLRDTSFQPCLHSESYFAP